MECYGDSPFVSGTGPAAAAGTSTPTNRLQEKKLASMPSVDGEWTLAYSGGLPPAETWASNPQFAIQPTVDGATYAIELVRHDVSGQARCGLWVMKADGVVPARKAEFTGMMEKSKVSTSERRSLELKLPLRKNSLPYIAMVALQEPGALGRFTLTVTSISRTRA